MRYADGCSPSTACNPIAVFQFSALAFCEGSPCRSYSSKAAKSLLAFSLLIDVVCLIRCCKDSANECNESLLSDCRVQPIFCKDSANECNESYFQIAECSLSSAKIINLIRFPNVLVQIMLYSSVCPNIVNTEYRG